MSVERYPQYSKIVTKDYSLRDFARRVWFVSQRPWYQIPYLFIYILVRLNSWKIIPLPFRIAVAVEEELEGGLISTNKF